jgi:geranylgeranyl diphosphate synthase type I
MHDQVAFKDRIDDVLQTFVAEETRHLTAITEDLEPVADQLRLAVADGKRLRAAFCYVGWRAAGQPDDDAAMRAAAAMELVHAAACVHDDIIDGSDTRHGMPSVHIALRDTIGKPQWRESGATGLAIVVGNLLAVWANHMFLTCGLPVAYLSRAQPLWSVLARELVAGECMEIMHTGDAPGTERSMQIIRFKTAKYTVERPLHIGATLGGASRKLLAIFSAYGVPIGEAFQLHDDLLGVFGDSQLTGKSNLDDLNGHKPTALVAVTLAIATGRDRSVLMGMLGRGNLDADDLAVVREIMERLGARAQIESMIEQRAASAQQAIRTRHLAPSSSDALRSLASTLVKRDF